MSRWKTYFRSIRAREQKTLMHVDMHSLWMLGPTAGVFVRFVCWGTRCHKHEAKFLLPLVLSPLDGQFSSFLHELLVETHVGPWVFRWGFQ